MQRMAIGEMNQGFESATIYALSSGAVPAGVAVVRISGPQAGGALKALAGGLPQPRRAAVRIIKDPGTGDSLDEALVLWFPAPRSFTGEDVAELHIHGGRAVVAAVLEAIGKQPGCRPAEPGEFTRRAFDAGRLDLAEVEGLADLIAAETEAQRRQALRQMGGALSRLYDGWRQRLLTARAMIEAELDFADEEDVPDSVSERIWADIDNLAREIERHLDQARGAERLRTGLQVVLLGPPNAGKSSLLNALARRDAAIVAEEAGTTRDVIEVHLDLGGYPVTLVDTAGLREAAGTVEREGIRRALERAEGADLVLWLLPSNEKDVVAIPGVAQRQMRAPIWRLRSKADLLPKIGSPDERSWIGASMDDNEIPVSVVEGNGVDVLLEKLLAFAACAVGNGDQVLATRERHRRLLERAVEAMRQASSKSERPLELRAEDLRAAADAVGRISGRIGVEDLLDVIFREFCIGK